MKIAIVHDWLVTNAGAEKVLKSICKIYPSADIYSLVDFLNNNERKEIIDGKKVTTSFIQSLPFSKKYFRNYLPLFPKAIESFNLSSYDLIISSSWAVAKGVRTTSTQTHICYCHTPIRYAWDLYDEYTSNLKGLKKIFVPLALSYIRKWDINSLSRVDYFIGNSNYVVNRITKTYNRKSISIYPPVDTSSFEFHEGKEDFYLTACRLVPYKKTKLIVESFNKMPDKKLYVIGSGEEFCSIKSIANNNITLLGYQEFKSMIHYMQRAKAFIYAAVEDFGIVPIEAMSCGTPVIALNKGGTAETVINKKNGLHFNEQSTASICNAVNEFEKLTFDYKSISNHAKTYSINRFEDELKSFINNSFNKKET